MSTTDNAVTEVPLMPLSNGTEASSSATAAPPVNVRADTREDKTDYPVDKSAVSLPCFFSIAWKTRVSPGKQGTYLGS